MSFFVGHSLAAVTVFAVGRQLSGSPYSKLVWLIWLIAVASAPDADYVFPALAAPANEAVRITHSIAVSLMLPLGTIAVLTVLRLSRNVFYELSAQVIAAGLSHLLLDLLVGVTPLPLLYPLSPIAFKLPFGLLPSAGQVQFSNFYFYRNLIIEIGILAPIFYAVVQVCSGRINYRQGKLKLALLTLTAICFLCWSVRLKR